MASNLLRGGCACGSVRYEIRARAPRMFCCHCRACQRQSGGPMLMLLATKPGELAVVSGKIAAYHSVSIGTRHFCSICGSPIYLSRVGNPGAISVFAGTLDHPEAFKPAFHAFAGDKASWLQLEPGAKLFARQAVEPAGRQAKSHGGKRSISIERK